MIILIQWLWVHLMLDFFVQQTGMVRHKLRLKARSWVLYAHSLAHGAFVWLFCWQPDLWFIGMIVAITHFFIDLWKVHQSNNLTYFTLDQVFHVLILFILWCVFISPSPWIIDALKWIKNDWNLWVILTGYTFITIPLSIFIYYATQRWRQIVEQGEWGKKEGLADAGKWIGIFERTIIYMLVLIDQVGGIGFLIAAKSLLRFNDIKGGDARKQTEYVLIGTLMSYAISMFVALMVRKSLITI